MIKLVNILKALKKRDKYVLMAIANLTWYCVAVLILSALGKSVPDSLTIAWFSAWTLELGLLYGIKIKTKENE